MIAPRTPGQPQSASQRILGGLMRPRGRGALAMLEPYEAETLDPITGEPLAPLSMPSRMAMTRGRGGALQALSTIGGEQLAPMPEGPGPLAMPKLGETPAVRKRGGVMGVLDSLGGRAQSALAKSDFTSGDFTRLGLSLMAAGEEGGGGWGAAAQAFGDVSQGARQRRIEDEELGVWRDEVAATKAERERLTGERTRAEQEREAWLATLPEADRPLARMFPEEYLARNRPVDPMITNDGIAIDPRTGAELFRVPDIVTEDEQLQRSLLKAQIGAANRQGQDGGGESISKQFQNLDARQIYDLNTSAQAMQTTGLPNLYALRDNIQAAIQEGQVGGAIPANARVRLDRLFNGSSGNRASLETWNARILQPAIAMFAGTGPLANKELELALNAMANPNMTADAALELINERIANAERQVLTAQLTTQFFRDAGGITGRVNAQGEDLPTFLNRALAASGGGVAEPGTARPSQPGASAPKPGRPERPKPTAGAVDALRADPTLAAEFDRKYGTSTDPTPSRRYLQRGWRGAYADRVD